MRILVLLFVTVSAAFIAQAQTAKPASAPPAKAVASGKVGYVDVEGVIAQLPEYKQLEVKLQEMQKKFSDDLFARQQNFERLYTQYVQNARSMPDSSRVKAENQLQQLDAEMAQFNQDAQNTFENTRKLFLGPVYLKLGGVIRDVAIENGYSMILPYQVGNGELLLHSDSKHNVSDLVVKKFTSN
ncbi:MAG TPA: OmpH family outer membrane protein [Chryseosolibacter sp.]